MVRSRLEVVQFLLDILLLVLSLRLASDVRTLVQLGIPAADGVFNIPPALYLIVIVVWAYIFSANDVYIHRFGTKFRYRLLNVVKSHIIACFLFFGVLYLSFRDLSRLESFYFVSFALIAFMVSRTLIRLGQIFFWDTQERKVHVLIAGTGANALHLRERIRSNPRNNLHLVGFVRLPFDDEIDPALADEIVGSVDDLLPIIEREHVGELVIVPRWYSREVSSRISALIYQLQRFPVNVRLAPDYSEVSFFQTVTENFDGLPLIGLRTPIFSPMQSLLKRIMDLVIAVPLTVLVSPILGIVALAVRLESKGPILLHQPRAGIHGRTFAMLKFRSMYVDVHLEEAEQEKVKNKADPRVTPVGRFLRRTSLDELPQLLNVIRGDMSLVGPRPELPMRVQNYEWWQFKRFEVPQGMTGWWQINGRADRPMHLHTEDDLFYIENYSLWLDLQILFRTLLIVFTGTGAY